MITISLCMIVKNEEDTLRRCIQSVKGIADEVIIVDTGSTDKTREIACELTEHVYDFEWIDDFSAARNFAYSKATKEYILILDADDVVLKEDRKKFKKLKRDLDPNVDIVMMKYNVGFDKAGNVTLSYYRERLSKRSRNFQWMEPVHEHLAYSGNVIYSDVCISHKKLHPSETGRNLRIYEKMIAEGRPLSARGLYYYGRELYYNARYGECILYMRQFLDGGLGWIEDNIGACLMLSKCYTFLKYHRDRLKPLFESFQYDLPRPEVCCEIGYFFKERQDYRRAKYWFERALAFEPTAGNLGFQFHDYTGYIPCMELCVCCNKLGNQEESIRYNEKAGEFKPEDPAYLYNKKYFEGLLEKQDAPEESEEKKETQQETGGDG
jgi:glycosyltransferase involved in cell wall biosynthesis